MKFFLTYLFVLFYILANAQQNQEDANCEFRSLSSTTAANIKITNNSDLTYDIYWVDWNGKRQYYSTLEPGYQVKQPTLGMLRR
jgi:hypothetical protein